MGKDGVHLTSVLLQSAVPLHLVEEMWALVKEGETVDMQSVHSDSEEHLMAISKHAYDL